MEFCASVRTLLTGATKHSQPTSVLLIFDVCAAAPQPQPRSLTFFSGKMCSSDSRHAGTAMKTLADKITNVQSQDTENQSYNLELEVASPLIINIKLINY